MDKRSKFKTIALRAGALALVAVTMISFQNFTKLKATTKDELQTVKPDEKVLVNPTLEMNIDPSVRERTTISLDNVADEQREPASANCSEVFGLQNSTQSSFSKKLSNALQKRPDIFLNEGCDAQDFDCTTYSYVFAGESSCEITCKDAGFAKHLQPLQAQLENTCTSLSGEKLFISQTTHFENSSDEDQTDCRCAVKIHFKKEP